MSLPYVSAKQRPDERKSLAVGPSGLQTSSFLFLFISFRQASLSPLGQDFVDYGAWTG